MIREIPRSELGLVTVAEACALRGWNVRTVQKWIADGRLEVVCAAEGRRNVYLLRRSDVEAFTEPPRGPKPKDEGPPPKKRAAPKNRKK